MEGGITAGRVLVGVPAALTLVSLVLVLLVLVWLALVSLVLVSVVELLWTPDEVALADNGAEVTVALSRLVVLSTES